MIQNTPFDTENAEKSTEHTESACIGAHLSGEPRLFLCAVCGSVFSVLEAVAVAALGLLWPLWLDMLAMSGKNRTSAILNLSKDVGRRQGVRTVSPTTTGCVALIIRA